MERKGESQLGKASLILSLISLITFVLHMASSPFLSAFVSVKAYEEIRSFLDLMALIIIFYTFLSLVSLCLGLVGIFQKTRVRKFAFTGTTISSAILIVYLILHKCFFLGLCK